MYPHNPRMGPPSGRFNEMLDQLRQEFESQLRANEGYEHQRKNITVARASWQVVEADETAVNAQVNEMQMVREKVYQMEQTQMSLKQK
jgi:general transcriptional corepressor TUP1